MQISDTELKEQSCELKKQINDHHELFFFPHTSSHKV